MTVRTRILLIFLVTLGSGFFVLERWLSLELRPRYYQSFEEPLVDMANILAEIASQEFDQAPPRFDRLQEALTRVYARQVNADIYGLIKNAVDIRVYITDRAGKVLFDSYQLDVGKDFAVWRDVSRTLQGQYGARSSPNDRRMRGIEQRESNSIAYIAAPVYRGNDLVGVLSVGKPKVTVSHFIMAARQDLLWTVLGVTVLVIVIATMLYLWVSRPLYQAARFAERIAAGEPVGAPDLGRNEIGTVVNAIDAMRKALDGKNYIEKYTQTLAHELKSPLTSIRASAELLLEEMPVAQRQRFIQNIQSENDRALNLIQRLLELAALENRQGSIETQTVALAELLAEIGASLQGTLEQRAIDLSIEHPIAFSVPGERFLIRQALFNVIDNAIDFSPDAGHIRISGYADEDWLVVSIRDHGAGIPDYARERIFERFYSLPRPGNRGRSSGLGLNFVKEVMELHQGRVEMVSHANGTEARLRFPHRG
ncbi:two-component system sensor histidine kinase CreC [Methylobacter marinus]|uniref:two-component system sensor histidine kinase CreC n=1 Tax=Methylobacter marinus TaxID=34058 RepID=UPI00036BF3E4|nr:two-component system sensor histidine kinase CreC [Methylobacter marinus]